MSEVQDSVNAFKLFAQIPTLKSAFILRHSETHSSACMTLSMRSYVSLSRQVKRPTIDIEQRKDKGKATLKARWVGSDGAPIEIDSDPVKARFSEHPLSQSTSPASTSTQRVVLLRETPDKGKGKRRSVELWKGDRLLSSLDVTGAHGSFFTNGIYASFSLCGNRVLYSAETKQSDKIADIAKRLRRSSENNGGYRDGLEAYEYKPPLGSLFNDVEYPSVFLLDFGSHLGEEAATKLFRIDPTSFTSSHKDLSLERSILGQAVFEPSGQSILLTAYPPLPDDRRLGLAACTSRPSLVLKLSCVPHMDDVSLPRLVNGIDSCASAQTWHPPKWEILSNPARSARSPAVVGISRCVWLECQTGGAHRSCDALMMFDGEQVSEELAIQSQSHTKESWPGLFSDQLCAINTVGNSAAILITTIWGSRQTIVMHCFGSRSDLIEVTPAGLQLEQSEMAHNDVDDIESCWSYVLHCTDGHNLILASRSNPTCPTEVLLGQVSTQSDGSPRVLWTLVNRLANDWDDAKALTELRIKEAKVVNIVPKQYVSSGAESSVELIVIQPKRSEDAKKRPGILVLHGGPHGTSCIDFSPAMAAMAYAGFTVIQPNYHGSLGRGQAFVESLVGQCGRLDVDDCHAAAQYAIASCNVDPKRFYVDGGSHGGFLALHLAGQYPTFYKAAIARNPVTSAHLMEGTNDIPDWFYLEFGLPFDFKHPPHCITAEQFETLAKASPLRYIDQLTSPVLLLTGLNDLRVAPSQSKVIYHALQAQVSSKRRHADSIRMLTFPDQGHPLDSVEAELVSFEARLRWAWAA